MKFTVQFPKSLNSSMKKAAQTAMLQLVNVAKERVAAIAKQRIRNASQTFINGIVVSVTSDSGTVELMGAVPNMMERGTTPFDIKKMLRGRPFVDVPLKHTAPGKGRQAMPAKVGNLMQSIASSARGASIRGPALQGKYGAMLMQRPKATGPVQRYTTIRRISKNSNPSSWLHPGFKRIGAFSLVAKEIRKLAPKFLAEAIAKGGK